MIEMTGWRLSDKVFWHHSKNFPLLASTPLNNKHCRDEINRFSSILLLKLFDTGKKEAPQGMEIRLSCKATLCSFKSHFMICVQDIYVCFFLDTAKAVKKKKKVSYLLHLQYRRDFDFQKENM